MAATEKTPRLRILAAKLQRAELQAAEAQLERLQRAAVLREQEAEFAYHQERRAEGRKDASRDREYGKEKYRPSYAVYTEVYFDETEKQWACQHGGVTAYGDTPAMACENFDHLWVYGK